MNEAANDNPSAVSRETARHGCLTTYLVFVIIVNSAMALMYVFGSEWLRRNGAKTPDWAFWALAIAGVVNVIAAVALLDGSGGVFWLFVASAIAGLAVNLSIGLPQGIFGAVFWHRHPLRSPPHREGPEGLATATVNPRKASNQAMQRTARWLAMCALSVYHPPAARGESCTGSRGR